MDERSLSLVPDMSSADIGQLVRALLENIERGELEATRDEVRFLRSVAAMLEPT